MSRELNKNIDILNILRTGNWEFIDPNIDVLKFKVVNGSGTLLETPGKNVQFVLENNGQIYYIKRLGSNNAAQEIDLSKRTAQIGINTLEFVAACAQSGTEYMGYEH